MNSVDPDQTVLVKAIDHYHNTAEEIRCLFDDNSKIFFVKSS